MSQLTPYVPRNCFAFSVVDPDMYVFGFTDRVNCWRLKLSDPERPVVERLAPVVSDCMPLPLTSYSTLVFASNAGVGDTRATSATGDSGTPTRRDSAVT